MYAVIQTGGKQYKVAKNDTIRVEKLDGEPGAKISFDQVLLVHDGKEVKVGKPTVEGAKVDGKIVDQVRGDKLTVFKKRRRKDSKRKQGHRQSLTVVEVTGIKG